MSGAGAIERSQSRFGVFSSSTPGFRATDTDPKIERRSGVLASAPMAIGRGKPDGGKGGRLGRSNMAYWGTNDEEKEAARKRRRRASRETIAEGVADAVAPDRVIARGRRRKGAG